jgi:hypothetical protein
MTIDPLRRLVRCMGVALAARGVAALPALWSWWAGSVSADSAGGVTPLFLAARWGIGLAAPAVACVLAWKTVQIRSTQSATGILYAATTLVLFGELTSLVLSRGTGVLF